MTLTRQELESKLWQAADILRGQFNPLSTSIRCSQRSGSFSMEQVVDLTSHLVLSTMVDQRAQRYDR